jgi:hemerythrin-like domain-containing protein
LAVRVAFTLEAAHYNAVVKRDPALVCLSREHHDGLVLSLRIGRELAGADDADVQALYADMLEFWEQSLLRHFRAEGECLLARLVRHVDLEDEMVTRTEADHLRMAGFVADMKDTSDVAVRAERIGQFGEALREHIRWEEENLFEVTQRVMAKAELRALGRDLEERLPPLCFPSLYGERGRPDPTS